MNIQIMKKIFKIIIHLTVWLALVLLLNNETFDLSWGGFDRSNGSLFFPLFYGTAFGALIFYLNIYKYIPKYFGKNKNKKYFRIAFGLLAAITLLEMIIDIVVLVSENFELAKTQLKENPSSATLIWLLMIFTSAFIPNLACWILAFAYRLPKDWIYSEKQKDQLEKDKLRSELDFLKAQINPHFLFNGINSIYHLIGEDDDMAKETLLQFSGLLRYQLYDCSGNYIPLEKELNYIRNYINIQKVRKGKDAVFDFKLPDTDENSVIKKYKIAPLLITPFLENAFKYLSYHSNPKNNFITLDFKLPASGILDLAITNSYDNTFKSQNESVGGIGLNNVKKRLNLLYPKEKHQLEITQTKNTFIVKLIIDLNEN